MEGQLHAWIVRQRNKRKPLTKRLVIHEAKKLYPGLHDLEDHHLVNWWLAFRRRHGITTRRIGSLARGGADLVKWLVLQYRANIYYFAQGAVPVAQ